MPKSILREHIDLIKEPLQRRQDGAKHKNWHNYTIFNVDQYLENHESKDLTAISSRSFSSGAKIDNDKWYVQVVFDHDCDSDYWAQVFFGSVRKSTPTRAICSLFVVDKNDKIIYIESASSSFSGGYCGLGELLKKNSPEEKFYLVNNSLNLRLKLTILLDDLTPLSGNPAIKLCPKKSLPHCFKILYKNREQSACQVIKIKGKQFPIHDIVLKLRCPKLLGLISSEDHQDDDDDNNYNNNNNSNNNNKNYDLELIDQKILKSFEQLIQFIYTDEISDVDDCIVPLYIMASKYSLQALERLCEKIICDYFLTVNNHTFFHKLAEQMKSSDLSCNVTGFMRLNVKNKMEF